jgi:FKBP-type peptidyl-prolyl cis-trans isomerase
MVRTRDRIIALVIAIAFFATSFAVSFFVIWELVRGNKEDKVTSDSTNVPTQRLQGTKLEGFTPVEKVDSLQKIDVKVGTGKEVKPGDSITVDYTGALAADGTIFESSLDSGRPASFALDGVIKGWTDGIPGMKEGGTRRLIIPAELAYGANPREGSGIPPNAPLVFDVTVLSVGAE